VLSYRGEAMYEYYNGYVIREGNEGISGNQLRQIYQDVGWINPSLPVWQNEKFEIAMKYSAWAFSVWHEDELIGMVRVISDRMMVASIQDLMVKSEHRNKGIGRKLVNLCLQKLPHGNWSAQTTPENYEFYKHCGFEMIEPSKTATLSYNGFIKAKLGGHR
jgi:GNAT superfamily N-acetyltransferase